MEEAGFLETDDGVQLRYTDRGKMNAGAGTVVFLHGWGANGRWFDRNVALAREVRMVTLDYRGMGESAHPGHGFRVSRLAADVRCLLAELNIERAVLCGTSLGCARPLRARAPNASARAARRLCGEHAAPHPSHRFTVIMSYLELFGYERIDGVAFVDQSACMASKPGWSTGAPELSNAAQVRTAHVHAHASLRARPRARAPCIHVACDTSSTRAGTIGTRTASRPRARKQFPHRSQSCARSSSSTLNRSPMGLSQPALAHRRQPTRRAPSSASRF